MLVSSIWQKYGSISTICFIIYLTSVLCKTLRLNNETETINDLVLRYPLHGLFPWLDGKIPYTFDFFSANLFADSRRLGSFVRSGLDYIERMSCLRFVEWDPVLLAAQTNITYLFYSYTSVLESCCLPTISRRTGRRMVLITPKCTQPQQVAHTTLHSFGMTHGKRMPLDEHTVRKILFINDCLKADEKKKIYDTGLNGI